MASSFALAVFVVFFASGVPVVCLMLSCLFFSCSFVCLRLCFFLFACLACCFCFCFCFGSCLFYIHLCSMFVRWLFGGSTVLCSCCSVLVMFFFRRRCSFRSCQTNAANHCGLWHMCLVDLLSVSSFPCLVCSLPLSLLVPFRLFPGRASLCSCFLFSVPCVLVCSFRVLFVLSNCFLGGLFL